MILKIIAAVTENGVIGRNNTMPWYMKDDLKHFKKYTKNSVVIMGRKTFESLNCKPLPNRYNIVISSKYNIPIFEENLLFTNSLHSALVQARSHDKDIFIIGGESLYDYVMNDISINGQPLEKIEFIITKILDDGKIEGDTFFPRWFMIKDMLSNDSIIDKIQKNEHNEYDAEIHKISVLYDKIL